LEGAGFKIKNKIHSVFTMRYLYGTAFLNNTFIILGFIDAWRGLFSEKDKPTFFQRFEQRLNEYAKSHGELMLTIPILYIECTK
jgi:hypothetical protein